MTETVLLFMILVLINALFFIMGFAAGSRYILRSFSNQFRTGEGFNFLDNKWNKYSIPGRFLSVKLAEFIASHPRLEKAFLKLGDRLFENN